MITDCFLIALAGCDAGQGTFTAEEQAQLAMALPEIAAELLEARGHNIPTPAEAGRARVIEVQLYLARQVFLSPIQHPAPIIRAACQTILTHGRGIETDAARDVLRSMDRAAA